jgi:hypothetical protein
VAVAGVLVAAGLTGCGGTKSYCSALKDDKPRLTKLAARSAEPGATGGKALGETVDVLAGLADRAPDDIKDEWDTLVQALRGLSDAIRESGADPGDFAGGAKPDGVSAGQLDAVQQAAHELQDLRVQQAGTSIEQHARDVCKVDLGSSGLGGSVG